MKLGDPIEVASCGSIMEYGGQHGNQTNSGSSTKQYQVERRAPKEHQREPIRPVTPAGVIRTASSEVKLNEQDKNLVCSLGAKIEQKPRLSDRRRMSPTTRDGPKLNRNSEHIEQQRQTKQSHQSESASTNLSQSSEVSPGANLLLHINHLSNQLSSATSRLSTKQWRATHHELNNNEQHQSPSLGPSPANVIDYITSPSVALAAAAAAQSVREQSLRHQEILDQFASLHSLSAVATAIQQTHDQFEMIQQQQRQVEQTLTKETPRPHQSHLNRLELAHSMQQPKSDSQQLQAFRLANLANFSNHQQSHDSSSHEAAPIVAQTVPSSGLLSASSSDDCNQARSLDLPMDLHQKRAAKTSDTLSSIDMANQEASRSALMDLMRRSSLLPHLAEASFRQSFVQLNQTMTIATQNDANFAIQNTLPTSRSSQAHSQIYPASSRPAGIRVGRRRGSRKCRKMYGMGQRQLWCTQCKWKKACSRFLCANQLNIGFNRTESMLAARNTSLAHGPGGANCCGPALGSMVEFGAQARALAQNSIAGERVGLS